MVSGIAVQILVEITQDTLPGAAHRNFIIQD